MSEDPYRSVVLDTAHWIKWIEESFSTDNVKRSRAQAFYSHLKSVGWLPLLNYHHVTELMCVGFNQARQRLNFITRLRQIYWTRSFNNRAMGRYEDIFIAEAMAMVHGAKTPGEIISMVKCDLVQKGKGSAMLGKTVAQLMINLHPQLELEVEKKRIVTAIAANHFVNPRLTVGSLKDRVVASRESRERVHYQGIKNLEAHLRDKGDKRLKGHGSIARDFMGHPDVPHEAGSSALDAILPDYLDAGILLEEIHDDMTVEDLGDLAQFRMALDIVMKATGTPYEVLQSAVDMKQCPHWIIHEQIRKNPAPSPRYPGSDLNDRQISALAAYADMTLVDKRTYDAVGRAGSGLEMFADAIMKVPHYYDIPDALPKAITS